MFETKWALSEKSRLTLLAMSAEGKTEVLVERLSAPGAFVLTFDLDGTVLLNGTDWDFGEDLMAYCSLVDDLVMGPRGDVVGHSTETEPYAE